MTERVVTVYMKPHCPPCAATVRKLGESGIEFTPASAEENRETLIQLGHREAPVVTIDPPLSTGEASWAGYRPDLIQRVLDERLLGGEVVDKDLLERSIDCSNDVHGRCEGRAAFTPCECLCHPREEE